ncbi:MAG: arsenic transporter [Pseudonocardia sp.]|uniref:ArsB/NhaD family transporter n=1 Tax=unclassified Pseudonocardia TaxID=2619320 RepID=UPI00086837C9|nr:MULTISPECIES: ArsB/NhaD family transporter [unclassified Pseudonocardia]MBN9107909.1 arsenic transporter [Pseudonocardia sp.]ODU25874.1 MAG: transporter [Pseudonocardia sp. SCN 72-51]ODV07403.1 MAG: transporter [Pseudonocardia sp. SCN 73-27]
MAAAVSALLLVVVLVVAAVRPRGLPEAVAAVPAAAIVVAVGLLPVPAALAEVSALGPTVGFLAAILLLGRLAEAEGVFEWLGARLAAGSRGRPVRLLGLVFAAASATTVVLSLDATVVLLTPVVLLTARRLAVPARAHAYACGHLSNSASLLLPVSNLTNLLAFSAAGVSFLGFAGVMALPWLVAIAVEYVVLRLFFRADLPEPTPTSPPAPAPANGAAPPRFALVVLGLTLVGFGVSSTIGLEPVWVAAAGAVVLAARSLAMRRIDVTGVVRAVDPLFCLFVLALGIVVAAVSAHGLTDLLRMLVPTQDATSLLMLLAVAGIAAVLANVVNNIPATLVLLDVVATAPPDVHTGLVLAVLLGVNIGPNLTFVGSLATLLWRQVLGARGTRVAAGEFTRLGLLTVPAALAAATCALWLGLQVL